MKNWYLAIRDQLPMRRLCRNVWNGNIFGLFHKRSHYRFDGNAKVAYSSKQSAVKAAAAMQRKYDAYFSNYKCAFCDGYHIGKNKA